MEVDFVMLKKLTPQEQVKCMREGICFKCRQFGHEAKIVFKSPVQSGFFAFFGTTGPQMVLEISQNPATGNRTHLDQSRTVFEQLQLVQD